MTDATQTQTASPAAAATPASAPAPAPAAATPAPAPAASTPAAPAESPAAAPAAAPAAPAAAPAPAGAPEKYEFKAPEGASAFDDKVLATYGDAARELNLTQDGAQALLAKVGPAIQAQQMAKLTEFYTDIGGMPDTWADQMKADKELGGAKLDETLAVAKKAMDIGGEPLVKMLNKTGLGNHPDLIRTFHRIGKMLSEDKFVPNGGGATNTLSAADRLYGKK